MTRHERGLLDTSVVIMLDRIADAAQLPAFRGIDGLEVIPVAIAGRRGRLRGPTLTRRPTEP